MPKIIQRDEQIKYCIYCNCELELGFNWRESDKKNYKYICKTCDTNHTKMWKIANPESTNRIKDKSRIKNPESYRMANRKWKKNNPNYQQDWRDENPDMVKGYNAKRRGLGDTFLFDNPFDDSISVVGHHISDGFEVYLPESLHLSHYHGVNTKLHRDELQFYVEEIYNVSYVIEESM